MKNSIHAANVWLLMSLFKGEIMKCAEVETHIFQSLVYFYIWNRS